MKLENIKQLTLREILHLTEDKFSIYMDKHIYENHENYDRNTFELVTVDLSISDYDLTQDFISIKVDEGWFNIVLNLEYIGINRANYFAWQNMNKLIESLPE